MEIYSKRLKIDQNLHTHSMVQFIIENNVNKQKDVVVKHNCIKATIPQILLTVPLSHNFLATSVTIVLKLYTEVPLIGCQHFYFCIVQGSPVIQTCSLIDEIQ